MCKCPNTVLGIIIKLLQQKGLHCEETYNDMLDNSELALVDG